MLNRDIYCLVHRKIGNVVTSQNRSRPTFQRLLPQFFIHLSDSHSLKFSSVVLANLGMCPPITFSTAQHPIV